MESESNHKWMTNRELTISSFHCLSSVPLIVVSAMYKLSPQFFRSADHDTFNQFFSPEKVFPQANSWVAEWVRITISVTVGQHKILPLNQNENKDTSLRSSYWCSPEYGGWWCISHDRHENVNKMDFVKIGGWHYYFDLTSWLLALYQSFSNPS